jgi:hypothetical protein
MLSKKTFALCVCVSVTRAAIPSPTTLGSDLWMLFQNDLDCKQRTYPLPTIST